MRYHSTIIKGIKINQLLVNSFWNNTHSVYLIVSPITKHWYVGMTTRTLIDRMAEHFRLPLSDLKLYNVLEKIGINFFLFIPIQVNVFVGLNNLEKVLISRFSPTLNSKLYHSKRFLDYRFVKKRSRWGKRRRITMRRLGGNFQRNNNTEPLKNWRSIPFFRISTENHFEETFVLEESLKTFEGEEITIDFDGKYSAKQCSKVLEDFGSSEVLSFVVHSNNRQFYFDGVTCGVMEKNYETFDLRQGKVRRNNVSTILDVNCIVHLCFVCICGTLNSCSKKCCNSITCCRKNTDQPCFLLHCYGIKQNSRISLFHVFKRLLHFGKGTITFRVNREKMICKNDRALFKTIFNNRGYYWRRKVGANSFTLNTLLRLLFVAKNLESWKERCGVIGKLRRWMKTKFGVRSERIVLKICFHKTIHFGVIREILEILISNTPLSYSVKKNLLRESRVIQVSRKKLSDLLCNHIQAAKSFKSSEQPKCVCGNTNGIHIDGKDVTLFSKDIQHIFSLGGNFVPELCHTNVKTELVNSFRTMLINYLMFFFGIDSSLIKMSFRLDFWNLLSFLGFKSDILDFIKAKLHNSALNRRYDKNTNTITDEQVILVRKKLKGFVISPKDKNVNELIIM